MKLAMFYNEMSLNCKVAHFEAMVSGDGIGSAIVVVQWVAARNRTMLEGTKLPNQRASKSAQR